MSAVSRTRCTRTAALNVTNLRVAESTLHQTTWPTYFLSRFHFPHLTIYRLAWGRYDGEFGRCVILTLAQEQQLNVEWYTWLYLAMSWGWWDVQCLTLIGDSRSQGRSMGSE